MANESMHGDVLAERGPKAFGYATGTECVEAAVCWRNVAQGTLEDESWHSDQAAISTELLTAGCYDMVAVMPRQQGAPAGFG